MKTCNRCGVVKDDEEFAWKMRFIKRHTICKSCQNEYRREWYETHSDQVKQRARENTASAREENRHFVYQYLLNHPCVDCGENDPLVLTFDHVRGKKRNSISVMVQYGWSLDSIKAEIGLCEVRCFNCHMKKEKQKRGTSYWLF